MLIDDTQRLARIDKLRELGLDKYVALPMLVVGGDQSSGKSSVLEALTGLPFPRDSSLCTRFPTNVVFKRSSEAKITASVIPLNGSFGKDSKTIATLDGHEMSGADLLDIFDKAASSMDLMPLTQSLSAGGKAFSKDMLKIEMASPHNEHFSVVDLPGLFRNATPGQTTEEDMSFVKEMMTVFMSNRRSIILAVVPANADIATQEIVQMALRADPDTIRTLGVFTKPDLVDKGAEEGILRLLSGSTTNSRLGYHVVCNRSQENLKISLASRNASEASFFASHDPWNKVASDRAGIGCLKQRLNELSVEAARRSYPELHKEMSHELDTCTDGLTQLGPEMVTDSDRRQHLLRIVTEFQFKTRDARDAMYERDTCFDSPKLRLATNVADMLERFNFVISRKSLCYRFKAQSDNSPESKDTDTDGESTSGPVSEGNDADDGEQAAEAQSDIYSWIRLEYKSTRGFEIGTVNPSVLPRLFKKQVEKWPKLASDLVADLTGAIRQFEADLMHVVCPEEPLRARLMRVLEAPIDEALQAFNKRMEQVMEVEFKGGAYTLNHYLTTELNRIRKSRYQNRLKRHDSWSAPNEVEETLIRLNDVIDLHKSNEDQVVDDLHDSLKAYCKVARKRFVDNVVRTAKYCLLESSAGPLQSCSPAFVGTLTPNQLQDIIQDDPNRQATRVALRQKQAALKEGLEILH